MSTSDQAKQSRPVSVHRKYWRPSRADRQPRADYLATVATSDEHKKELARAKQARYRARKKVKA